MRRHILKEYTVKKCTSGLLLAIVDCCYRPTSGGGLTGKNPFGTKEVMSLMFSVGVELESSTARETTAKEIKDDIRRGLEESSK